MTCCNIITAPSHHLFLGLSVVGFEGSVGWNNESSSLTVRLREDNCAGPKVLYNECLTAVDWSGADHGFYGEQRWQRADGSEYSSCVAEDSGSDTLIRDALNLLGGPAYFRVDASGGSFEYCGFISNWEKNTSCNGGVEYTVQLVDPKELLANIQLIIGDYAGRVDQVVSVGSGGNGCPAPNIFNVFGYAEQFGIFCPPMLQCQPGTYDFLTSHLNPDNTINTITCPSGAVDGEVFGTWIGGFGGSNWNEDGMPLLTILSSFNLLCNAVSPIQNVFSPYGRAMFYKYSIPGSLTGIASGLMDPDTGSGCFADKNYYFIDLSEIQGLVTNIQYRIAGTSISLLDLINKLSEDFAFDYYIELLAVPSGTPCVSKVIKLRTVSRRTQQSLGTLCSFLENSECKVEWSSGLELRNEATSTFLIGSPKRFIFQAEQRTNPDADFTSPANAVDELVSVDSATQSLRLEAGCDSIDDTIIPFFGVDTNGDLIVPCQDGSGYWYFDVEAATLTTSLYASNYNGLLIRLHELELMYANAGYEFWMQYIHIVGTDTSTIVPILPLIEMGEVQAPLNQGQAVLARDAKNPKIDKHAQADQLQEDMQKIYEWVLVYAQQYYGKRFAVRTPFTCGWYDSSRNKIRISEQPVNDGGWTEMPTVLNLPNYGPIELGGFAFLNAFRNEDGLIRAFVRWDNGMTKVLTDASSDDYLLYYIVDDIGNVDTGFGAPVGAPGAHNIYVDLDTDIIYIYNPDTSLWDRADTTNAMTYGSGGPPAAVPQAYACIYVDLDTGAVYFNNDVTPVVSGDNFLISDWEPITSYLYMKAEVQEEYVFHDGSNLYGPRVVVELPQAVGHAGTGLGMGSLKQIMISAGLNPAQQNLLDKLVESIGGTEGQSRVSRQAADISAAAIPMLSNTITYGPWFNPTVGGVAVEQDDSLNPWTYGSYSVMNAAGNLLVNENRSEMLFGESGSITIQGYPSLPLGAELGAYDGGFYGGGEHLAENRSFTLVNFSGTDYSGNVINVDYNTIVYTGGYWTGLYGPNITGISVRTEASNSCNISTTYNMRTYSPRRFKLNKYISDQLRQIYKVRTEVSKRLRLMARTIRRWAYGYEI